MKRFGWFGSLVAAIALTVHPAAARSQDRSRPSAVGSPLLLSSGQPVVGVTAASSNPAIGPGARAVSITGFRASGFSACRRRRLVAGILGITTATAMWNPATGPARSGTTAASTTAIVLWGRVRRPVVRQTYRYNRVVTRVNDIRNSWIHGRRHSAHLHGFNGGRGIDAHRRHGSRGSRVSIIALTEVQRRHVTEAARDPRLRQTGARQTCTYTFLRNRRTRNRCIRSRCTRSRCTHQRNTRSRCTRNRCIRSRSIRSRCIRSRCTQPVHTRRCIAAMIAAPMHTQPVHQQPEQKPADTEHGPQPHGTSRPG